jgi:Cu/Ag efflux pump CusA
LAESLLPSVQWWTLPVMIENAHKRVEAWHARHPGQPCEAKRMRVMTEAAVEVGPALFFSLMIITLSFIPVFTLQAQEGVSSHPGLYQDLRHGSGGYR